MQVVGGLIGYIIVVLKGTVACELGIGWLVDYSGSELVASGL